MKEWLYVREKSKKARAAVSMRKDRRGYERNTKVGTNDLHIGGGGGEGVLSGNREFVSGEGNAHEDERTTFDVIEGGRERYSFGITSTHRSNFYAMHAPQNGRA